MNEWYDSLEEKEDTFTPENGQEDNPLYMGWNKEENLSKALPNYKDYKWYKSPKEQGSYMFSMGEQMENALQSKDNEQVENIIENNPSQAKETLQEVVDVDNGITQSEVEPLLNEIEQLEDNDKRTDEVSDKVIEDVVKDISQDEEDFTKDISKKEYDNMSIDEIEKADEMAMKGESPYLKVNDMLDMDMSEEEYYEYLSDIAIPQEQFDEFIDTLDDEQIEEIKKEKDKKKKFDLLKMFYLKANPEPISTTSSNISDEETSLVENTPSTSGVKTVGNFLPGNASGSVVSVDGLSQNIEEKQSLQSTSNKSDVKEPLVAQRDSNESSMNGANSNKGIDDTFDDLSFKEEEHQKNIKSDEQADLPNEEFHEESRKRTELKPPKEEDLKSKIKKDSKTWNSDNSGTKYLPFRFFIDNDKILVSQIGTARKEDIDTFIKNEPNAAKTISTLI